MPGLLLGLLLWVSALVVIHTAGPGLHVNLAKGQRAPQTVVAVADFTCTDVAQTELKRLQAANAVPPVFAVNFEPHNLTIRSIEKLFNRMAELRQAGTRAEGADINQGIAYVLDLLDLQLSAADAQQLAPPGREQEVLGAMRTAMNEVWDAGIISPSEKESLFRGIASSGSVGLRQAEGQLRTPVPISSLSLPEEAAEAAARRITALLPGLTIPKRTVSAFLRTLMAPNLVYDPRLTEENRKFAEQSVPTVTMQVRAGTTLVEAGERITPQMLASLNAHAARRGELESAYDRVVKRIGSGGLLLVGLIVCAGLLHLLRPDLLRQDSTILLLVCLSLLALFPARGLLYLSDHLRIIPPPLVEFALPLALAPLLVSILLGSPAAIPLGLWNSLAVSLLFGNSFTVLLLGLSVTIVAALAAQDVRRRSQIYRAGVFVGLAAMLCAISLATIHGQTLIAGAAQAAAGLASGLLCAFLAALLVPLFELLFSRTTNLTLLEFSDMSHPLLQRLAMEAPGTYHHSIVTANLGLAAASRIGANGLLVRVCAFFHDVGKLSKPEFFSENTPLRNNPHDDLSPNMSALVITSHVKEGVGIARRYKLPPCVVDAIEQHHGTGLVSYFYHVARHQEAGAAGTPGAVDETDFRYDGPRPRSREIAILSLADAVEAASRSLEKPTPTRIEGLVDEIVRGKLNDGQLDESGLTLSELSEVKRSFVSTLASMLHVRIAYPSDETRNLQSPGTAASTHAERLASDTVAGAPDGDTRLPPVVE